MNIVGKHDGKFHGRTQMFIIYSITKLLWLFQPCIQIQETPHKYLQHTIYITSSPFQFSAEFFFILFHTKKTTNKVGNAYELKIEENLSKALLFQRMLSHCVKARKKSTRFSRKKNSFKMSGSTNFNSIFLKICFCKDLFF